MNSKGPVSVDVMNFTDFFNDSSLPLSVDTYQRGFVWDDEKIEQLAQDLLEYQKLIGPQPPYYMGTLLVHKSNIKSERYIIDGQQRLTALNILHHRLSSSLPKNFSLTYSPKSSRRIQRAAQIFGQLAELPSKQVFPNISFTVIEVEQVDLAFTFFDTQNNRGVPLHATDLLKAYHLRSVTGNSKEDLQMLCARGWESIQLSPSVMTHEKDFAPSLFNKFLWRACNWKGKQIGYGGHDDLMDSFQKNTWPASGKSNSIPLYRSRQNRLGQSLELLQGGQRVMQTHPITISDRAADLPFAIRQPVHKGIGFFLYAEKYASLIQWLVLEETNSEELVKFREVYKSLILNNSIYLREIFLLSTLMYVDQFGDRQLCEFSLWLEHALGAIRLKKQQVRHEAAIIFFRDDQLNLLDVIAGAYLPEQVIGYLKDHHQQRDIYATESIKTKAGVQGRYKEAVLNYFERDETESLADKAKWITNKMKGNAYAV